MKKSCSATLLKREIYLTLMKLFIQHSKKLNKKNQEVDERHMKLHYKKTKLLLEETLVLEGGDLTCMGVSQAVIFSMVYFQA